MRLPPPFPPASVGASARLFDERSPEDFRAVYGQLLARATALDVALTRIRLSALDFARSEVSSVGAIRLLLAEVNAVQLEGEAHGVMVRSERHETLSLMARRLSEGRIEVRSAPLGGWSPDFSVFHDPTGPAAALLGFHWFERPFPHRGPAFVSQHGPDGARLALQRFDEIWARAHDISAAVSGILARAERAKPIAPQPLSSPRKAGHRT